MARGEAPDAGFEQSGGSPASEAAPRGGIAAIAAAGQEAQTLYQLGQKLGNSLSLDETLRVLSRMLRRLMAFNCFAIYLRDEDCMKPVFVSGDDQRLFQGHMVKIGDGIAGWVAKTSNTIINGNPAVELGPLHKNGTKLKSALAVPIHTVREGRDQVLGVMVIYSIHADAFTRDNLRVLRAVAEKAAGSIENSLDYQRVESEAVTDFLTGILNSRGFSLEAEKKIAASEGQVTLLACDLDEFKSVNDTEGHAIGDLLLRKVAEILVNLCGPDALLRGLAETSLSPSFPVSQKGRHANSCSRSIAPSRRRRQRCCRDAGSGQAWVQQHSDSMARRWPMWLRWPTGACTTRSAAPAKTAACSKLRGRPDAIGARDHSAARASSPH